MADAAPTAPMEPPSEPGRRRKQRRLIAYILVAIIVVAVLATTAYVLLSGRPQPTTRSLRIGLSGQTAKSLNPNVFTLTLEFVVVYNIYSTLATRDGAYHVVGDLAYAWEAAPDNVPWTFHPAKNANSTAPANPGVRTHPSTAADSLFPNNLVPARYTMTRTAISQAVQSSCVGTQTTLATPNIATSSGRMRSDSFSSRARVRWRAASRRGPTTWTSSTTSPHPCISVV